MRFFDQEKFIRANITQRETSLFEADLNEHSDLLSLQIKGKSILVIGGAGTIGSSYIKSILPFCPARLTVVDFSENGLTELTRDLRSSYNEVLPKDYITYPFDFGSKLFEKFYLSNQFDVIACFAAHKHVRSEKDHYAIEAMIRNNVFNTHKLLELSCHTPPEHFFSVSTEKATNAASVMGASKRLMEQVLMSYSNEFKISTARFANVAFSNGSLLDGFNQRLAKQQPISAPSDVKRYFVSPLESGQLCMLSCFLGKSADVFFPKLDKDQTMTFSTIAEKYLFEIGLEPDFSSTEQEARDKAKNWKPTNKKYPVYFFQSDTSGEKQFEEFYTSEDNVIFDGYHGIGIIRNKIKLEMDIIKNILLEFQSLFDLGNVEKKQIVSFLSETVPDFVHIETGKYLDQKM